MTIVMTGGGSGGHITPILAVAAALKAVEPTIKIVYVGQTGDRLADVPAKDPHIDQVFTVRAGKFRRYHGLGWKQWFDIQTGWLNVRDLIYITIGLFQSWRLMGKLRPAIIFTRGGFVSVPVALGGHLRGVPYITHDSDSTPSLANRLIARWAALHAVALPEDVYPYPSAKTVMVGIPISPDYVPVTTSLQATYRQALQLPPAAEVLLVTGGGNGAAKLNTIMLANVVELLGAHPHLQILHVAGRAHQTEVAAAYDQLLPTPARSQVRVEGFVTDQYRYSGAADVIIARGGATNIAEFAAQAKACIIVPSPQLIWNVKNNQLLSDRGAIEQLTETQAEQPQRLAQLVDHLLEDPARRHQLATELASLARPDSAAKMAELLINLTADHRR